MVEWLGSLGSWALAIAARLGLPVAILFALGYSLHRRHCGAGLGLPVHQVVRAGHTPGLFEYRRPVRQRCWEVRGCPPEVRERCPAFQQPDQPCWRAVKQSPGGRIESKCLECSLLLTR